MNSIEIIKQIDKEINILYICIIQVIINLIITIVIKKKIFTDGNYINKILLRSIWMFSTLPLILYTYPVYKQNFLAPLSFIILTFGVIGYNVYQFTKIDKKYGLLSFMLSLNFLLVGFFILIILNF